MIFIKKYIYKITNIINNKVYIGQTKDYKKRFRDHIRQLRKNTHDNPYLQSAWNKYGEENFTFEVLEYAENYNEREIFYIQLFNSLSHNNGYNILPGGENPPLNASATLLIDEVKQIQNMLLNQDSIAEVCKQFTTVTRGQIVKINNGTSWHDKNLQYPLKKCRDDEIGHETANSIMNELLTGFLTQKEIAKKYNVARTCVTAINQGKVDAYYDPQYTYPLRTSRCVGSICDDPKVVDEIINELKVSKLSAAKLAKQYNISDALMHDINHGRGRYFRSSETYPIRTK